MATERLAPDAILEQTNLVGTLAAIDEDPDSPDGSWLTASSNNADSILRVSFPTPTGNPVNTQGFRVQVRKISGQSGNPTARIELYENGSLLATLLSDTTVTSTTGVVLEGTFNASALGTANGSLVECRIYGTKTGGSPGTRNTIEVGAVEWNVEYAEPAPPVSGDGASSFGISTAATAKQGFSGDGATSLATSTAATGTVTAPSFAGDASVAFGASSAASGRLAMRADGAVAFGITSAATSQLTHRASGSVALRIAAAAEGKQAFHGDATTQIIFSTSGSGTRTLAGFAGEGEVAFSPSTAITGKQTFRGAGGTSHLIVTASSGTYTPAAITASGDVAFGLQTSGSGTVDNPGAAAAITFGIASTGQARLAFAGSGSTTLGHSTLGTATASTPPAGDASVAFTASVEGHGTQRFRGIGAVLIGVASRGRQDNIARVRSGRRPIVKQRAQSRRRIREKRQRRLTTPLLMGLRRTQRSRIRTG